MDAWQGGSIDAGDWLGWAILSGLVLVTVLASGSALRPHWTATAAIGALLGLAAWDAISWHWSADPSSARDEALRVVFYAIAFAVPLLSLRSETGRKLALAMIVFAVGALAVGIGIRLLLEAHPADFYDEARLAAPIGYVDSQATVFVLAFWPAMVLASDRALPVVVRALTFTSAAAAVAGWISTQTKAAGLALGVASIVFLALSRSRTRPVIPALLVAAIAAPAFRALTTPYRAAIGAEDSSAHDAARALLVVAGIAFVVGLAYAILDTRIRVGARTARNAGYAIAALGVLAIAVGAGEFLVKEHHPESWLRAKWNEFKVPAVEGGTSHFGTVGSTRYGLWRVAWKEFERHPVAGIGSWGFGAAYLQDETIERSSARSHSLELDALAETGIIGFALLAGGLGFAFAASGRRARASVPVAAATAASAGWLAHASVDWAWTVPAAAVPFFLLLGIGASPATTAPIRRAVAYGAIVVVLAVVIVGMVPRWLSARYVQDAYNRPANWEQVLRRAKRLDPLSVDPYIAQAVLTKDHAEAVSALRKAIAKQPRAAELWFLLGSKQLSYGNRRAALRALAQAHRLAPLDSVIKNTIYEARKPANG